MFFGFLSRLIRNDTAWLCLFVGFVLGAPVILGRAALDRHPFNPDPREEIIREQPEIVFIGDSMLDSRIDPMRLEELTGKRLTLLEHNGSASGMWYLFLKNYVADSGVHPQRVVIFFRDRYLTDPDYRLRGQYLEELHEAMEGEEPVVDQFLDAHDNGRLPLLEEFLDRLYPSQQLRDPLSDKITGKLKGAVDAALPGRVNFDRALDQTFDIRNLRPDVPSELASEDLDKSSFDSSPEKSFLPHMLDIARENGFQLTFYRVKRRPLDGDIRVDPPELTAYLADLKRYLESQGAELIDETADPDIGIAWYGDGDHISEKWKRHYTEAFFRKNKRLFQ